MSVVTTTIKEYLSEMKALEKTYLGFPNNMAYDWEPAQEAAKIYLNNAGDPFSTLSWKKHTKFHEQDVIKFFLKLFKLNKEEGWGYMTSGGTEGNMEGLLLAREAFTDGILYFSQDSHYSIAKIANILKIPSRMIPSLVNGEIDYKELKQELSLNTDKPVILSLNCGTTVKGAYDNLGKVKKILKDLNITRRYIHVDAALSGMIIPFLKDAPQYSFKNGIDSIAVSMHKFLGCPIMSGVVVAKKKYVENITQKIEYINSNDTTILGSRNGQAPIYVWYMLNAYGKERFTTDAKNCINNAKYLTSELKRIGYEVNLNENSVTVYFKKPAHELIEKWQLSVYGEIAHIVVMQHVTKTVIDKFISDMLNIVNYNQQ